MWWGEGTGLGNHGAASAYLHSTQSNPDVQDPASGVFVYVAPL